MSEKNEFLKYYCDEYGNFYIADDKEVLLSYGIREALQPKLNPDLTKYIEYNGKKYNAINTNGKRLSFKEVDDKWYLTDVYVKIKEEEQKESE